MRISTMQMFRQGTSSILEQQSRLASTQQQLSTGKRIVKPSDDPTGAARLVGLSASSAVTGQYQNNILAVRNRQEIEDAALAGVVDNLQRARELAVQGLNDSNTPADRAAIALEVRQLRNEVLGLANRKDGNGQYLFSGFQSNTVPFSETSPGTVAYNGDQGQRQIQIGPVRQVADGDDGRSVFMDIPDGSGGTEDLFATLEKLATDLEADAPDGASLDQIDTALDQILTFRAAVGARLNALDSQESINGAVLNQLEQTRSAIEDLDYAEAATRLSRESVALQAAQQAFVKVQNLSLFNYL
ncbi:MAG TPA: flagellar hook-associated protein 3 [Gammaproteobacteria bacterium]|nr:flagellar hook-associated protein 3 [Gammaproteobacteria bacterium]